MRLGKLLRKKARGIGPDRKDVAMVPHGADEHDIVFTALDGVGKVHGVTVVGQPGDACRIGFMPGVGDLKNVELRFMGQKTHSRVTIILGLIERGQVVIKINGSDTRVQFGSSKLMNADCVVGPNAEVTIGDHTTAGGVAVAAKHSRVTIGTDCMISGKVQINSAMHHAIVDLSGDAPRIERDPPHLRVADHVWIGNSASLLGNCTVGSGSVIGWGAVVASKIPTHAVAAGNPARVIRKAATWTRNPESIDLMTKDYIETNFEAIAASANETSLNQAGQAHSEGTQP